MRKRSGLSNTTINERSIVHDLSINSNMSDTSSKSRDKTPLIELNNSDLSGNNPALSFKDDVGVNVDANVNVEARNDQFVDDTAANAPLLNETQHPHSATDPEEREAGGGNASILICVINLLNTVAGTGMLGLPGAYAGAGFLTGSVLLVAAAFFSFMGLRLLAISAKTVHGGNGAASFYSVATAAVPQFTIFIDAAVAVKGFGVATSYLITVGDCMSESFKYILTSRNLDEDQDQNQDESTSILTNRHFWVFSALLFVLPISFFKTLSALKFTSTLSLGLIYILAVVIIMYAEGVFEPCQDDSAMSYHLDFDDVMYEEKVQRNMEYSQYGDNANDETCTGETNLVTNFDSTVKNIAIFVFSFACHQNVFTIVNEVKNATRKRVDLVLGTVIATALILYLIVAIEGYRTYGSEVKGDILLNYPQTRLVTMMRMSIAIMVILSYPLQIDPSRRCLTSLINAEKKRRQRRQQQQQGFGEQEDIMPYSLAPSDAENTAHPLVNQEPENELELTQEIGNNYLFNKITCSFLMFSFIIAMSVSDLGFVLGIVGATGSTIVSYILPGAVYIKLHPHPHMLKSFAYLQLLLGVIIAPTALYFVIFKGGRG